MIPDAIIGPEQSTGADLVPLPSLSPAVPLLEQVREYIRASKAESTFSDSRFGHAYYERIRSRHRNCATETRIGNDRRRNYDRNDTSA